MFSKSISITNCKIHFSKVFQLLLSITLDKRPEIQNTKYKILLTKVLEIQNTFRSHCESISQSVNEYLFNKQEKHMHISRLCFGTVTVTVQCTIMYGK